jgi:serine/threonine-protein kinase
MSAGLVLSGRYRLTNKLSEGGMGSVWRAEDMTLGAEVAVKLIDPAFTNSADALKRFQREAQAAAKIRSTHVVQILDHGVDNGTPFIAMELLRGESLAERLHRVGTLNPEQTGRIMGHAGRALELAHANRIVHRDMKPGNIFLVSEGDEEIGKVLDFGIARQASGLADSTGLKTETGHVLGTPYYMSPEQAAGQDLDHLTDVWSFGVIACECLTGLRAFEAASIGALFHAICMAPLPIPSQLGPVPDGFDDWFALAAARNKRARFQSIKAATEALKIICGRASTRPSALPRLPDRSNPALWDGVPRPVVTPRSEQTVPIFQTTTVPSSRSVPEVSSSVNLRRVAVVLAAGAIAIGGLYLGWRWMSQGKSIAMRETVASQLPPAAVLTSAAPLTAGNPSATRPENSQRNTGLKAPSTEPKAQEPTRPPQRHVAPPKPVDAMTRHSTAVSEPARDPPPTVSATPVPAASTTVPKNVAGI